MKKIISILLVLALIFTMSACKSDFADDGAAAIIEDENSPATEMTENVTDEPKNETTVKTETEQNVVEIPKDLPDTEVSTEKQTGTQQTQTVDEAEAESKTENTNQTVTESEKEDDTATLVLTTYLPYSIEEGLKSSDLIVECEFIQKVRAIRILSGESGKNFTEYKFKVLDTLRGQTDKEEIIVRLPGGDVGGENISYDGIPTFNTDEKYVLFLYKPDLYSSYSTGDDSYKLIHESYGAFRLAYEKNGRHYFNCNGNLVLEQDEHGDFMTEGLKFDGSKEHLEKSMSETFFVMSDFKEYVSEFNKTHPIDPDYRKNLFIERYNEKVEKGDMTREEADRAIENRQYGKITAEAKL